jgi:hypothetical protein
MDSITIEETVTFQFFIKKKRFWEKVIADFPLMPRGRRTKRRVQQFVYCCVCICCRCNVLPSRCLATIAG